ncbi:hypothetical protein [Shewanella sp.]|uniref:hypothetical protein n=1 Tax=Shewanella sp. TaxID=50422 RepID=UPI0040477821
MVVGIVFLISSAASEFDVCSWGWWHVFFLFLFLVTLAVCECELALNAYDHVPRDILMIILRELVEGRTVGQCENDGSKAISHVINLHYKTFVNIEKEIRRQQDVDWNFIIKMKRKLVHNVSNAVCNRRRRMVAALKDSQSDDYKQSLLSRYLTSGSV